MGAPDAKIIFTKAPFIQYKQILLDKNFKQYLEKIMVSEKILPMGFQRNTNTKNMWNSCRFWFNQYRLFRFQQTIWLVRNNFGLWQKWQTHNNLWQLQCWINNKIHKICKADKLYWNIQKKYLKIYLTNEKKYDMDNLIQKHLLYKQFIAWTWNGCSTAPLTDYINNPIYQVLIDKDECDSDKSNERVYLDLAASSGYTEEAEKLERNDSEINLTILLKKAATKKLRLRIWTYSLGEYLYVLSRQGLTLRHKIYSISQ